MEENKVATREKLAAAIKSKLPKDTVWCADDCMGCKERAGLIADAILQSSDLRVTLVEPPLGFAIWGLIP